MAADLSSLDLVALMIDGVHFGVHCCVVALRIDIDGVTHPLAPGVGLSSCVGLFVKRRDAPHRAHQAGLLQGQDVLARPELAAAVGVHEGAVG